MGETRPRRRAAARYAIALLYMIAGVAHLHSPGSFLPVMPDWVPFPTPTVLLTGVCELAGAAGLLWPRTRRLAAILLALYAVCVFPVNIKHAWLDLTGQRHDGLGLWYHVPRLIAQPLLVWLTLFAGNVFAGDAKLRRG